MKILPITAGMDVASVDQINRFTDGSSVYIIETTKDYEALPDSIKAMLGSEALSVLIGLGSKA